MATCPKLIVPLQIDLARGDRRSLFRRTADPSACESAFKDAVGPRHSASSADAPPAGRSVRARPAERR